MTLGEQVWGSSCGSSSTAHAQDTGPTLPSAPITQILQEAAESQKREKTLRKVLQSTEREPELHYKTSATTAAVDNWLQELRDRRDESRENRPVANAEQFDAVKKIAERVKDELRAQGDDVQDDHAPLRWAVHGGPGTGKSHVIKLIKELFTRLGWNSGVEYQIVALQAVMAEQLGGDTIHHACGIPVFDRGNGVGDYHQRNTEVAKRVLQWRWLIIDEISMVSAKLLADLDLKLRQVVRDLGTRKINQHGHDRPFGGLNIVICGDLWQLAPPEGGFLGAIPVEFLKRARQFKPAPTIAHGQALVWSGPEHGIQGVTELDESERTRNDPWLQEVQEEIRHGRLSEDNHNFLHGRPTNVPGSWAFGDVLCGNEGCRALGQRQKEAAATPSGKRPLPLSKDEISARECATCREEHRKAP